MACGDVDSFHDLALEYFDDVHTRMTQWAGMYSAREYERLSEEFHRCKGVAAMFGFERLFDLLGSWETETKIENGDLDLKRIASEVEAAENAVAARRRGRSNG